MDPPPPLCDPLDPPVIAAVNNASDVGSVLIRSLHRRDVAGPRRRAQSDSRLSVIRACAPRALAGLFIASGALHLLRPRVFAPAMPTGLPAPGVIILASGIAELVCAGGLLSGRRWAGVSSAALLVAVFPANVTMAFGTAADPDSSRQARFAAWARLPLQVPLVWAALQARSSEGRVTDERVTRMGRRE